MKQLIFALFILVAIAQWVVPGKIIFSKKEILQKGKLFKFLTEPIDPENPFTGKYIYLRFREDHFSVPKNSKQNFAYGDEVYVLLKNNDSGFVTISGLSKINPGKNDDFVKARIDYIDEQNWDSSAKTNHINIKYSFDEFYMDEYKAPKAETLYRNANRDSTQKTYALVYILDGKAVIKDVMINEKSISELLKNNR